jgi:transcription-repair coupling factor (superfamily II helicase)
VPFDLTTFHKALKAFSSEEAVSFTSLSGSSGALFFSLLEPPCLLLCSSEESARQFYGDSLFWSTVLGKEAPIHIPEKGEQHRIKGIAGLYSEKEIKAIASVDSAGLPVWDRVIFRETDVARGMTIDRNFLLQELHKKGYIGVPVVSGEGEMSARGGILDIFPPDSVNPVRIEFFGDEVESIRYFDIDTQLSLEEIDKIPVCPAVEPDEGTSLMDFLSGGTLLLNEPDDILRRYAGMEETLKEREFAALTSLPVEDSGLNLGICGVDGHGLLREERKDLADFIQRAIDLRRSYLIMMVCSSEGQARRLKDLFVEEDSDVSIVSAGDVVHYEHSPLITIGHLTKGFTFNDVIVLSEQDIFGKRPDYRPARKSRVSNLISSIEDFKAGDYLVHIDHGIGRFMGIEKEKVEDYEGDFIAIEYLGGDKLFVPLDRINYVQKYHAPEGTKPGIDRLGGKTWQRTKQKVRNKVKDMAQKLIKIYARRTSSRGTAFSGDTELHREFDGFFLFEETPDQITSINEIKGDMEENAPMDRLLCGDVGYGKTEVVMRACFKAVYDSRQVAVLVPTTILAEQHFETFVSRFSAFPVRVDFLSRFKSRAEQKETIKALAEGQIDIIIGTHRLLAKDVQFHDLGLLVIDEEHKFGVAHKERIKALRSHIDILSLSATPIPRTLHMAMSGIRGMSVIETPPEDRLAVKSTVARFNTPLIKEVLQSELDRGGQAFFVNNRIKDIYEMANFLGGLVSSARIGVAHGQMKEKELEEVMKKFFHREIDVLVSTAIIGSGLDIPSANTIIINRADRFGLADLYQLRGRVGRSNVKAYAYFLIPGEDIITEEARKKLQAIQELGYLGAGFRLALRDLEIRGAGNLLGAEQSGHIAAVGFDMYMEMLETAVAELKGEKTLPKIEPVIDLKITAIIPDEYIENPDLRLSIYRKIASAKDKKSLDRIRDELKDRFGALPEKTGRLIEIMNLKVLAARLLISEIRNIEGKVRILFASDTPVSPEQIFALYSARKGYIKFVPEGGIELDLRGKGWAGVYKELKGLIKELMT